MINLATTIFFFLKIAAPILGFNGAGGILLIIPFLLGGRFPHLFTILLTSMLASNFFRASGIPCLLYIDDRHNSELQVALDKGKYATLNTANDRHLAVVGLFYFLGLQKSISFPSKVVPYLGFLADSSWEVFCLKPDKKREVSAPCP